MQGSEFPYWHVANESSESALEAVNAVPSLSTGAHLMLGEIDPLEDDVLPPPVLVFPVLVLLDSAFCGSPAGQVLEPEEKDPSAKK